MSEMWGNCQARAKGSPPRSPRAQGWRSRLRPAVVFVEAAAAKRSSARLISLPASMVSQSVQGLSNCQDTAITDLDRLDSRREVFDMKFHSVPVFCTRKGRIEQCLNAMSTSQMRCDITLVRNEIVPLICQLVDTQTRLESAGQIES